MALSSFLFSGAYSLPMQFTFKHFDDLTLIICRRLEAMKNKHKKAKTEENEDFPGCEKIKFGDVQAPPKLVAIPKVKFNIL